MVNSWGSGLMAGLSLLVAATLRKACISHLDIIH